MSVGAFEDKSVLFITPCFLARRLHKEIRGVEVFDLLLLRRLVELGIRVTVGAEATWRGRLEHHLAGAMPEVIYTPNLIKPLWNGLALAPRLIGRRFDAMVLGNVGNGVGTVARLLRGRCGRTVLIAHREPRAPFLRALRGDFVDVVAVNEAIGAAFGAGPNWRVTVRYGVPNAEMYRERRDRADGVVRFAMVGRLDTPLKRVDMVLEAFRSLAPEALAVSELHLMGYPKPPTDLPPRVVAYPWMTVEQVAERLPDMDVLVVASESETFCQALVQGMLCGLPGLVRRLPTLVEKVEPDGGIVFDSPASLREGMERLARDAALRRACGEVARRRANERYIWDAAWFAREHLFPKA